jgi:hypothetical protein
VQLKVKQTIGQDPWLSFPTLPAVYPAGKQTAEEIEFAFWQSVKESRTPEEISTIERAIPTDNLRRSPAL